MKLFAVKSEQNEFEKAQQELQRDLTPQERTWLLLADELLKRAEKRLLLKRLGKDRLPEKFRSKAA